MFNIIARKTLLEYCRRYPLAATALLEWYHEMVKSEYRNFNELKQNLGNASLIGDDRIVFNIMGNQYRLVVRIAFEYKAIQIKWFGTQEEYNEVDMVAVKFRKPKS